MAQPLDSRIRAAMGKDARLATVAGLVDEIGGEIDAARAEFARQDAVSKSATATEDAAESAADEAAKLSRRIVRLEAKQQQLGDRHTELENSESQQRVRVEREAVEARRDALAAELAERWPVITAEIVDLLTRLRESDFECARHRGLFSAEAVARKCAPSFYYAYGPMLRFERTRLPSLLGRDTEELAWPQWSTPGASHATPVPM